MRQTRILDETQFDRLFDGNVKGMLFSVQKALPLMTDVLKCWLLDSQFPRLQDRLTTRIW